MKNILITVIGDVGNEPEVIRQSLESFGYSVLIRYIGRPNDIIDILKGDEHSFKFDCLIISCHGDNGSIVMPELFESVYEQNEPRGNFNADMVNAFISIDNKLIINTGCTTGLPELASAFSNKNTYIAPYDYMEGKSCIFFVIRFFYEMAANQKSIYEAYEIAKSSDNETKPFTLFNKQTNKN